MGGEPAQRRFVAGTQPRRKVHDEEVDLVTGDKCRGQRPALVDIRRPEHQQPAKVDTTADSLERIEDATQVQERDDPATRLGLGKAVQGERGLATGTRATERGAHAARQTARAEKRVQVLEAGGHDLIR